mgnify:CR=1 FL=1
MKISTARKFHRIHGDRKSPAKQSEKDSPGIFVSLFSNRFENKDKLGMIYYNFLRQAIYKR